MTDLVTLVDCPPGLFMHGDTLGFKSEYKSPSTHVPGGYKVDAYCVESGEFFWGGTSNALHRESLMVEPIDYRPPSETPASITAWASDTFGEAGSDARVAARANEEMAELLRAVTSDQPTGLIIEEAADVVIILCRLAGRNGADLWAAVEEKLIIEEAADVVIILCRLAGRNGADLWAAVEEKMKVNRARVWKNDGTGHGYHVRDKWA